MDKTANKQGCPTKKIQAKKKTKQGCPVNKASMKKKHHKLTRAEYDDLRQIDWVPFDPYSI